MKSLRSRERVVKIWNLMNTNHSPSVICFWLSLSEYDPQLTLCKLL